MSFAIACWVRDTALSENEKDMAYKKAMLGGLMKSTTTMNTQIKGQKIYKETFEQKYEEEIKSTKEFLWIYKG
jgi:fructose-bisphosphate aldolase class 1